MPSSPKIPMMPAGDVTRDQRSPTTSLNRAGQQADPEIYRALSMLCHVLQTLLLRYNERVISSGEATFDEDVQSDLFALLAEIEASRPCDREMSVAEAVFWQEVDRLRTLAMGLQANSMDTIAVPPTYDKVIIADESLNAVEFNAIASAIEKLIMALPRMVDQTVTLTDRQEKNMAAANLGGLIDRLLAGNKYFEDQRAKRGSKSEALSDLIDILLRADRRRFVDQRCELSATQRNFFEIGPILNALERMENTRYINQDWKSREISIMEHMASLCQQLEKKTQFVAQRYVLSPRKEKSLFLLNTINRVDRLVNRHYVETFKAKACKPVRSLGQRMN
ncbi:hypothetical protein HDU76_008429 [Blyttiomyces sp. JEL0837]|nr:hypothetical protein HDU76_008429 [Blyttiomyces sp. JEL0837]